MSAFFCAIHSAACLSIFSALLQCRNLFPEHDCGGACSSSQCLENARYRFKRAIGKTLRARIRRREQQYDWENQRENCSAPHRHTLLTAATRRRSQRAEPDYGNTGCCHETTKRERRETRAVRMKHVER